MIAVFQDIDNDDRLDKNLLGKTKAPHGFSKNTFGVFGPPDFQDVSFEVQGGKQVSLMISMDRASAEIIPGDN